MSDRKTIVFFPEGSYGPTNNCVGIGDVLRRRGHRVVFIVEESFAGTLEAKGFEERTMRLASPPEEPEEPGQFWKDFIRDTAPVFRKSTFEQLGEFIGPTWQAFRYEYARQVGELQESFSEFCVERGAPALPDLELIHESPWLNLTIYPDELDYPRSRPLGPAWRNLQTSVRATDAPWSSPDADGR